MSANVNGMVKEAIRAYRAGHKDEAQALLMKAVDLDQYNEQAWMWLSAVVVSLEDRIVCLENVLDINPDNADARRGLTMLQAQREKEQQAQQAKSANPFEGVDVTEFGDLDADFMADLRADAVGDSMSEGASEPSGYEAVFEASDVVFDAVSFDEDDPFGADAELDEENPFGSGETFEVDEPFAESAVGLDDPIPSIGDTSFGLDPMDDSTEDEGEFDTLEDVFAVPPEKGSARKADRVQSPMPTSGKGEVSFSSSSADADPGVYFSQIPADIKPTRVPGLDETYPRYLVPMISFLVVANLAALVLLLL